MTRTGKRVLLIEPSSTLRALLHTHLCISRHQCLAYGSYIDGLRALKALANEPPEIVFLATQAYRQFLTIVKGIQALCPSARLMLMVAEDVRERAIIRKIVSEHDVILITKPYTV